MRRLLCIAFFLLPIISIGQDSFYDIVKLGKYDIGFCDSLIFCKNDKPYTEYKYSGETPLFLQIWHPNNETGNYLHLDDFRKRELNKELESVYLPFLQGMDTSFVKYNIIKNYVTWDSIQYEGITPFELLDSLKMHPTRSHYSKLEKKTDFPLIIYHHGSEGLSDENYIMAEYFASRGYVFVSSNFHLQHEIIGYGYNEGFALPKSVIEFARSLTTSKDVFFIGHSWGAQIGLSLIHEEDLVDGFVSLESTLEFFDSTQVTKMWPELDSIMNKHEQEYATPMLLIAGTKEDKPHRVFENLTNAPAVHASVKEEFGHDSYTSAFLLRSLYSDQFMQPDLKEMGGQLLLYNEHLKLIEDFLTSCRTGSVLDKTKFQENFYITITNTNANKK